MVYDYREQRLIVNVKELTGKELLGILDSMLQTLYCRSTNLLYIDPKNYKFLMSSNVYQLLDTYERECPWIQLFRNYVNCTFSYRGFEIIRDNDLAPDVIRLESINIQSPSEFYFKYGNLVADTVTDGIRKMCKEWEEKEMATRLERSIKKVIFNDPATIILWNDGTKTVVHCGENDVYDKEKGMAMAIVKHLMLNKGNFNELFKKYIPELKED